MKWTYIHMTSTVRWYTEDRDLNRGTAHSIYFVYKGLGSYEEIYQMVIL